MHEAHTKKGKIMRRWHRYASSISSTMSTSSCGARAGRVTRSGACRVESAAAGYSLSGRRAGKLGGGRSDESIAGKVAASAGN